MSYFILEMNVICVEGLEEFDLISSPNLSVYVMVVLKGASLKDQNAKTNMVEGGQNPSWNHAMKFFIDRSKQIQALKSHLMFTIVSKNNNEEHKNVGQINVPIVELLQVFKHQNGMQNISYPVKKFSSGHTTNGTFKFKFKFVQPVQLQSSCTCKSSSSALQSQAKEEEKPVKKRGKWKGIVAKVMVGLLVSVGGGSLSRLIFEQGQKGSSSTNYSLPSTSDTIVSPNSFYDSQATPISTGQDAAAPVTIDDPTMMSFYYNSSPLATFPDINDTPVVPDLATPFYNNDDLPVADIPSDNPSMVPVDDPTPLCEAGDTSTVLDSVVHGVLSSFA